MIEDDTAVAVSKIPVDAGVAWEFAFIVNKGWVLVQHAKSALEVVGKGATKTNSTGGEGEALGRDIDAVSTFEELSAVALDALNTFIVD